MCCIYKRALTGMAAVPISAYRYGSHTPLSSLIRTVAVPVSTALVLLLSGDGPMMTPQKVIHYEKI